MRTRVEDGVEYVFKDYIDDPAAYENLANTIVKQAAEDYLSSTEFIEKNKEEANRIKQLEKSGKELKEKEKNLIRDYRKAVRTKTECVRFFHGEWFKLLTDLDGDTLIGQIHELRKENPA